MGLIIKVLTDCLKNMSLIVETAICINYNYTLIMFIQYLNQLLNYNELIITVFLVVNEYVINSEITKHNTIVVYIVQ